MSDGWIDRVRTRRFWGIFWGIYSGVKSLLGGESDLIGRFGFAGWGQNGQSMWVAVGVGGVLFDDYYFYSMFGDIYLGCDGGGYKNTNEVVQTSQV